jgi:hypothetical protein
VFPPPPGLLGQIMPLYNDFIMISNYIKSSQRLQDRKNGICAQIIGVFSKHNTESSIYGGKEKILVFFHFPVAFSGKCDIIYSVASRKEVVYWGIAKR